MDFSWSEEQLAYKNAAIEFGKNQLNDDLVRRDKDGKFSRSFWDKCAEFGMQGLPIPEQYGGQSQDILTTTLVLEALGYACKDSGLLFSLGAQLLSVQMPILHFGTEEQKKRYLPRLCNGEWIGAHGMTEPESGSDAFSLSTTATLRDGCYVLNGSKTFITNAPIADLFLVFATVDKRKGFMGVTAFLVEKDFPGIEVGSPIEKMGLKTSPMAEVFLQDCHVPIENRLGSEGNGAAIFRDSMDWERSCILANYLGAMERQLESCISYAKQRRQFKKPIGKFQSIANKIVDMKVRLETARWTLYKAAWSKENGGDSLLDAAIAKLYLSESWVQSCLDAVQVHGGYGYTTEFEIERDFRDSIAGTLYSGTSDIQKNIIAGQLGL